MRPVGRFRVKKEETAAFLIEYDLFVAFAKIKKMAQIPLSYYTVPFNAEYDYEATTNTINYVRPVASADQFLMPFVAPRLDGVMLHAEVAMHRLQVSDTESDISDEATDYASLFDPSPPVALVVLPAVVIPKLPAVVKTITKTITEIVTVESKETITETVTETITETITTRKAKRVCHRACLI